VLVDSTKLDDYVGRFLVNPDRVLTITKEYGKLYGEPTLSPRTELFPVSENEFLRSDVSVRYSFERNASGKVDSIKLKFSDGGSEAPRISPGELIPYEQLMAGRLAEAAEGYKKIKAEMPKSIAVSEARLNDLGYSLLQQGKGVEAIIVLKVNVELYPQSANAYDSIAEAYMTKGEKALAIVNYKKSLELNPQNKDAIGMLKKLER
jgi:tetratricopeptide (TPR) repeat protein